jgi:hypothetical protein
MWQMYMQQEPWIFSNGQYWWNPNVGKFPASTPMSFALLCAACLSQDPADRPVACCVREVLQSLVRELKSGLYIDLAGGSHVRIPAPAKFISCPSMHIGR